MCLVVNITKYHIRTTPLNSSPTDITITALLQRLNRYKMMYEAHKNIVCLDETTSDLSWRCQLGLINDMLWQTLLRLHISVFSTC
jgi:hypothetical protein